MFEQLVRPFAARPVTTTRRIVPVVSNAAPEIAIITWGKAGSLPEGVVQPAGVDLENIESIGFNLHSCAETWSQSKRVGKDIEMPIKNPNGATIGTTIIDRTQELTFSRKEAEVQPFSFAAVGVSQVIEGLRRSIPGSNSCSATYKFNY